MRTARRGLDFFVEHANLCGFNWLVCLLSRGEKYYWDSLTMLINSIYVSSLAFFQSILAEGTTLVVNLPGR